MANYNFTMKQFNGEDYDTLYPQTTSQQSLLNDNVLATILELSGNPNVDDALNGLKNYTDKHFEFISYGGDGQAGASHPCSLSFNYAPKAVFFLGCNSTTSWTSNAWSSSESGMSKFVMTVDSLTTNYLPYPGGNGFGINIGEGSNPAYSYGKKSSDGKTISWYCDGTGAVSLDTKQLNLDGVTYYFLGVW